MNLFKTLIAKPLRWLASSTEGKKGRDFVDKYEPILEKAVIAWQPQFALNSADALKGMVAGWAEDNGVPASESARFADEVAKRVGVKA
jgi:hypothetical protein